MPLCPAALLQVRALKYQMSDANLRQLPEFQARLRVLQRLKYVSEERTIELKGRVMCEVQVTNF